MNTHRSVLIRAYGGANVAEVAEIPKPEAGPGQVLVRVRAAGVNGIDWKVRGLCSKCIPAATARRSGHRVGGCC